MRRSAGISLAATLLASAALLPASVGADEEGVKAGVLRCDVGSGVGFIFGSTKDVECLYSPGGDKATEKYVGEIKKFGVDIGYSKSGVMVWAVLAPSADVKAGALAGSAARRRQFDLASAGQHHRHRGHQRRGRSWRTGP
jgi:hypothetical protein